MDRRKKNMTFVKRETGVKGRVRMTVPCVIRAPGEMKRWRQDMGGLQGTKLVSFLSCLYKILWMPIKLCYCLKYMKTCYIIMFFFLTVFFVFLFFCRDSKDVMNTVTIWVSAKLFFIFYFVDYTFYSALPVFVFVFFPPFFLCTPFVF